MLEVQKLISSQTQIPKHYCEICFERRYLSTKQKCSGLAPTGSKTGDGIVFSLEPNTHSPFSVMSLKIFFTLVANATKIVFPWTALWKKRYAKATCGV